MKPMYVLCPHCAFPVVVHPVEIGSLRRCRQCREEFIPGGTIPEKNPSGRHAARSSAQSLLRAAVRQRRRSIR